VFNQVLEGIQGIHCLQCSMGSAHEITKAPDVEIFKNKMKCFKRQLLDVAYG
jgi:hypothetical protein